ncbi:E3 ubiquitin-protein ligase RNF8 [Orchesella cincta]|uniref:E3 ubiquitin-protein ligase RNF8 n=1 Tax=Orchesella cincta TaxID=48709 RepID=A0A1D2MMA2_ORCCI|nr:E3 ubiquitin-protein ligase RNF8 [Orchesella cincta]
MSEEESVGESVEREGQNELFLDAVSRYIGNYNNESNSIADGGPRYGAADDVNDREDFSILLGPGEGGLSFRDVLVGMVLPHRSVSSTTTSCSNVSSSPASEEEPFYSPCTCPTELINGGSETGEEGQPIRCTSLEEYKCPICLDTFINTVRVDCSYGHKFCNFCIQCWINIGSHLVTECPVCRDPIFGKRLDLKTDAEIRSIVEQLTENEKSERLLAIKERLQSEFPNVNFHEYPGVDFNGSSNARTEGAHQDLRSTLFDLGRATSAPVSGLSHSFGGRCPFSSFPMISGRNDSLSHTAPWTTSSSTALLNVDTDAQQGGTRSFADDPYHQLFGPQGNVSAAGNWNPPDVTPTSDDAFARGSNVNVSWFPASGLSSNATPNNGLHHQPSYAAAARSTSEHNHNHNAFSSSSVGYLANRSSTTPSIQLANQRLNQVAPRVARSVETSGFNPMTYGVRQSHSFPCYYPPSSSSMGAVVNTNSCGYHHHGCYLPSCHNHRSMSAHQLQSPDIGQSQIGHSVHTIPTLNSYGNLGSQLTQQQQIQRSGAGDASQASSSPNSSFWDTSSNTVVMNSGIGTTGISSAARLTPRMPGRHCMSFQLPRPMVTSTSSPPPPPTAAPNSCSLSTPPDLNNGGNLLGARPVSNGSPQISTNEEISGHPSTTTTSQVGFRPPGSGSCHHHHYHYIQNLETTSSTSPPNTSRQLPGSTGGNGVNANNAYSAPPHPPNTSGRGTLRVAQYPNPSESAHFSGGFSLFSGGYIGFQINHIPMSVDDRVGPVPGRITHPLVSLVPLNSDGSSTRISLTFEVHRV